MYGGFELRSLPPAAGYPEGLSESGRNNLYAGELLQENFDVAPEGVGDQCTAGLNFDPCRPRLDILKDYLKVVETIYTPESYFKRISTSHRRGSGINVRRV